MVSKIQQDYNLVVLSHGHSALISQNTRNSGDMYCAALTMTMPPSPIWWTAMVIDCSLAAPAAPLVTQNVLDEELWVWRERDQEKQDVLLIT